MFSPATLLVAGLVTFFLSTFVGAFVADKGDPGGDPGRALDGVIIIVVGWSVSATLVVLGVTGWLCSF